jgi:hypothetical protein
MSILIEGFSDFTQFLKEISRYFPELGHELLLNILIACEIWCSHSGEDKDDVVLGCDAV